MCVSYSASSKYKGACVGRTVVLARSSGRARGERARRARAPDGEPELGRRPARVAYMRIAPARAFYRPVVSMASRQACSLSSLERETSGTRGYCTVPGHRAMCA